MAAGDYRACDVCGGKTFYDARLNYVWDDERSEYDTGPVVEENGTVDIKDGYILAYLGSWACVCDDCSKTHTARVLTRDEAIELDRRRAVTAEETTR